ncbi:restriction endonuclease subunit S [uncultured Gelidibacter sp.]|uniref:restriction endonuclease subunit S n=1 Tax=uncultured Gelidibacter sp. TaxID=259318 RepID=UPI002634891A|nr:restriction endonuclease subunit S [uncultured Gelidibacter sp.]
MELLEQHFQIALESPDGITKLRELVLKLAMSGKLANQPDNGDSTNDLLLELKVLKQNLTKKDFAPRNIAKSNFEESYSIPSNWVWTSLETLGIFINGDRGKNYPSKKDYVENGIPFINAGHLDNGIVQLREMNYISETSYDKLGGGKIEENDILYCLRGSLGKCAITRNIKKGAIASSLVIIRPLISDMSLFLYYYLISPLGKSMIYKYDNGTAQPNLSSANIQKFIIPLPPLEEQKRIVAKIEELLSLCNQLEKQRNSKNEILSKFNDSTLNKLIKADDESSFGKAANYLKDKFNELYSSESNVKSLKKAILNLGISGKFKIASNGSKHDKKYPTIPEKEEPFKLPTNWIWTRLDTLGETQTGTTPPKKNPEYYGDYIPFLGPGDIKDFKIDYSNNGLSELGKEKARFIPANSILMVCIGGSIGKMAINDRDVTCNQQVNTITPYEGVHLNYLSAVMQSDYFQTKILANAGGSATPIINKGKWISIPIPLPPLDIQIEISDKIEKLLSLCNSLENSIGQVSKKQVQILNSVLANI